MTIQAEVSPDQGLRALFDATFDEREEMRRLTCDRWEEAGEVEAAIKAISVFGINE